MLGGVIAGFGLGYRSNEFDSFGISMDDRVTRYEESVAVLRGRWPVLPDGGPGQLPERRRGGLSGGGHGAP